MEKYNELDILYKEIKEKKKNYEDSFEGILVNAIKNAFPSNKDIIAMGRKQNYSTTIAYQYNKLKK